MFAKLRWTGWCAALAMTLILAAGVTPEAGAQSASEGEGSASPSGQITWEKPLAQLLSRADPIYLPNSSSARTIFVPLSPRIELTSAVLHLEYTNSIALLEDRSVLRVSIGDTILAQLPLKRNQPSAVVDIRLPLSLLEAGYNPLNFWVAQHYTLQCEDPSAPELWTQIDAQRSTVTFTGRWRPVEPSLATLDELVDARLATDYALTLVTAGEPRDQHLKWGGLITQGISLRLRYQPLQVFHARSLAARPAARSTDVVVVGTRDEVASLLGRSAVAGVEGAYLGMQPLPSDPNRFLLVVSGRDDEEVSRAVDAFAFMRLPLPDSPSTLIEGLEVPDWPAYSARHAVRETGKYPFSYFDHETLTLQGISAPAVDLPIWLPGDLFSRESSMVEISLHFAYGAGLRRDSVLNIFLNGRFERVIHLRDEDGGVFRDYKIYIPLRSFRGGANTLSFIPRMMPLITGECQAVQDQNLLLTIFDDSTINLPDAAHYVRMPNLALFSRAGFPFTSDQWGEDVAVQLLGTDTETVAAAWMVLGKLAQVVSRPLFAAEVTFSQPPEDRDVLVVGPAELMPPDLRRAAPVSLGGIGPSAHPTALRRIPAPGDEGLLGRLFGERLRLGPPPVEAMPVEVTHGGELGRHVVALQFESPWESSRSVVAILASTPERLRAGVHQAVSTGIWDAMSGDLAIWSGEEGSLRSYMVGPVYHVGDLSVQGRLEYYFSRNPWFWTFLLILLMVLFALLTVLLLRRYRQKNLAGIEERTPEEEWGGGYDREIIPQAPAGEHTSYEPHDTDQDPPPWRPDRNADQGEPGDPGDPDWDEPGGGRDGGRDG